MTNKISSLISKAQDIVTKTADLLHSYASDQERKKILENAAKGIHSLFENKIAIDRIPKNELSLQEEAIEYVRNHPILKPFFSQLFPAIQFPEVTHIFAICDTGLGNALALRGSDPFSWEKGTPLQNRASNVWEYRANVDLGSFEYKIFFNDEKPDEKVARGWEERAKNRNPQEAKVILPDFTCFGKKEPPESHQRAQLLNTIYSAQLEFEKIKAKYQEAKQSNDWKTALSELRSRITPLFESAVHVDTLPSLQERKGQNADYPAYLAPFVSQMALIFYDQNLKKIASELARNISDINRDSIKHQLMPLLMLCDRVPDTAGRLHDKLFDSQ
jgi:hypothetical protein